MKKLSLTVIGMYCLFLSAFSQSHRDTSLYKSQPLTLEEVNLVSGYYHQDGDHASVMGGIGSQRLNDVSNTIDLKFASVNPRSDKFTLNLQAGIDHHTAASSAYISTTGASKIGGTRIYPSIGFTVEKANGFEYGMGVSLSSEYNYHSKGLNFMVGKLSSDKNTEINFKGQAYFDKVKLIQPSELIPKTTQTSVSTYTTASGRIVSGRGGEYEDSKSLIPSSPRNTFSGSFTLSHIVNKNLQFAVMADGVAQSGYLGLPFYRVYFKEIDSARIEKLPDTRFKLPLGIRLNYFAGDKLIFRTYYRFYTDSWGIRANTASVEVPYKMSPFVSISPFYRYYQQTASPYFAPYKMHSTEDTYYSSNYDYASFSSNYYGINIKLTPKDGVLHIPAFNTLELRYGHYTQTTGLQANNIGVSLKFK